MELDLCFKLVNGFTYLICFTNEIFGQLLPNYSRYAANLNMKAVSFFFTHPVQGASKEGNRALVRASLVCASAFII